LQNRCYLILNVYAIVLKASVRYPSRETTPKNTWFQKHWCLPIYVTTIFASFRRRALSLVQLTILWNKLSSNICKNIHRCDVWWNRSFQAGLTCERIYIKIIFWIGPIAFLPITTTHENIIPSLSLVNHTFFTRL
jgi:hypothetical protein